MIRPTLVALALLSACGNPDAICYSPCGVPLTAGDCEGFAAAEIRALAALSDLVPEFEGRDLCRDLGTVTAVQITDSVEVNGFDVNGKIDCSILGSSISLTGWQSLTHEYTHHLLRCAEDHDDWSARGILKAINRSNAGLPGAP